MTPDYYTCFYPFDSATGDWKIQTDDPELIKVMRERCHNPRSPWRVVGRGDIWMFARYYYGSKEAKRGFQRILDGSALFSYTLSPIKGKSGWELDT